MVKKDKDQPLYVISVVAEMLGVHPQTLRLYEREGFVCPKRYNRQRKYSEEDIERLDMIIQLTRDLGVNKAGVEIILRMRGIIDALNTQLEDVLPYLEEETREDVRSRLMRIFKETV
ncbi:MerR family transcriptional regulator [Candidatus Magnetobacterium casense]|uniref:MerR family transcriptional regulator n=1 Tax=Candidatus Magnetobacterium casense TaxID=1455061 RepID=UPI00058F420F|nr:MerR family transcriptional regulator [Candidatus Magnetobacterium casensis]